MVRMVWLVAVECPRNLLEIRSNKLNIRYHFKEFNRIPLSPNHQHFQNNWHLLCVLPDYSFPRFILYFVWKLSYYCRKRFLYFMYQNIQIFKNECLQISSVHCNSLSLPKVLPINWSNIKLIKVILNFVQNNFYRLRHVLFLRNTLHQ